MTDSPTPAHATSPATVGSRLDDLHGAIRAVIALPLISTVGMGGLVALFFSAVVSSGCFIECTSTPRPIIGWLLLWPAAGAGVAAVVLLIWAMSPLHARSLSWCDHAVAVGAIVGLLGVLVAGVWDSPIVVAGLSVLGLVALLATRPRRLATIPTALLHGTEAMPARVRGVLAGVVVTADVAWVAFVTAISSCGFAGGRCPSETPLWASEGLHLAGWWTLAAGATVVALTGRSRRPIAWASAAAVATMAGLMAA